MTPQNDLLITMDMLSKLGVSVLPDHHLCLFGRLLNGIVLPKNMLLQISILKGLLAWYSPCLLVNGSNYQISNVCFEQRENQFLDTFLGSFQYSLSPTMPQTPIRKLIKRKSSSNDYLLRLIK